ncbi:MAG TPA: competence protein [Rhodobacteraceae bacterium]|nr:ComEC family competence protein [Paracoccaceae bacterium]HBG99300.1 competence protein [Paracoccaceae bacterium]
MTRAGIEAVLLAQRGHWFLWLPVALAVGIGLWFGLRWEPAPLHYAAMVGLALAALLATRVTDPAWHPLAIGVVAICAGFVLAGYRAHAVAGPVLGFRYYGPVEGRVVALDRSWSNAPRITLDRVVLDDTDPARVPGRVRIALHGDPGPVTPRPGERVAVTAWLSPPAGPVEPGGYDFRRHAWFQGLGAVGYARSPLVRIEPAGGGGPALRLFALRMEIADWLRRALPGREGAFAAAIVVGDRSGLDRPALDALRASNLAHLLAISGLHMGLLTGTVFGAIRLFLALIPPLALRLPAKKIAAAAALAAGLAYLLLSGAAVATERAFIMAAVILGAVLLDLRAITLRAVALAAILVLAIRPETLTGPGFQMSFAATTALVAAFAGLRDWGMRRAEAGRAYRLPAWARGVAAVAISSAVAGAATAPIAAAHFNQIAQYGLLANLASVPVMGLVVMPALLLALMLWPLGLAGPALAVAGLGIGWILGVAETVAGWPAATRPIVKPPGEVLPLLAFGLLFALLWRGRARLAGLGLGLVALVLWQGAARPDLLVSADGKLLGAMTEAGRGLDRARGNGFIAEAWLENDGDAAAQETAAARRAAPSLHVIRVERDAGPAALADACRHADVVIVEGRAAGDACLVIDAALRARLGAIAVRRGADGLVVSGADAVAGRRLWAPGNAPDGTRAPDPD